MRHYITRAEGADGRPPPPAAAGTIGSLVLRGLDSPDTWVRFDSYPSEQVAPAAGEAYRIAAEEHGSWTQSPGYAVMAEWQVAEPAQTEAFQVSRRELFALRRRHLPTFAVDWLLARAGIPGRFLVLGLYGDKQGATELCRLHPAIHAYSQAHPASAFDAHQLGGLRFFSVETYSTGYRP